MSNEYSERQPLTAPSLGSQNSSSTLIVVEQPKKLSKSGSINVNDIKQFLTLYDNGIFGVEQCNHNFDKLQEAQKQVFQHAISVDDTARKNRVALEKQTSKVRNHLEGVRQIIGLIEPSKPGLSDLDLRNAKFKTLVRSYKDFLEKYINLLLESQRFTAALLENQLRLIYPNISASELDKAISSASDNNPPVMIQVLLQKGVMKNDKDTRLITHAVQDIHQDLRHLNFMLLKISEFRHEANIIMQRYRRRWPIAIKQGKDVYVINDDLNLLEKTDASRPIDYDGLLRKRERRNKIIVNLISLVTFIIIVGIIVSTTLFSNF